MGLPRRFLLGLACLVAVCSAQPARGQGPEPTQASIAERLFAEGRELAAKGDSAGACRRFEESRALDPTAVGPSLNLALCKKERFQYASAARLFREVIERSPTRPDRIALSKQHLDDITPRLSSVKVVVSPAAREGGLALTLDQRPLPETEWNSEVFVDGGTHVIEVRRVGAEPTQLPFSVDNEAGRAVVSVPEPEAPPPPPPEPPRTAGWVVFGAGALFLVGGSVLGVSLAARCGGFFKTTCDEANGLPSPEREEKLDALRTQGWIATAAVGVGVIGMGVGSFMVLAPRKKNDIKAGLRAVPQIAGASVVLDGAF